MDHDLASLYMCSYIILLLVCRLDDCLFHPKLNTYADLCSDAASHGFLFFTKNIINFQSDQMELRPITQRNFVPLKCVQELMICTYQPYLLLCNHIYSHYFVLEPMQHKSWKQTALFCFLSARGVNGTDRSARRPTIRIQEN